MLIIKARHNLGRALIPQPHLFNINYTCHHFLQLNSHAIVFEPKMYNLQISEKSNR